MNFTGIVLKNLFNIPLMCFLLGISLSFTKKNFRLPAKVSSLITVFILFCIGLKAGSPLAEQFSSAAYLLSVILASLIAWALLHPLISYFLLKSFTRIDSATAAAVAASFASVSVMTFITAISFLDQGKIPYKNAIIASLAIMDIPAILSGIFIAKKFDNTLSSQSLSFAKVLKESLLNKAILALIAGLTSGIILYNTGSVSVAEPILVFLKPMMCVFLFDMGVCVGMQKESFRTFSWSLGMFGVYMPIIGGSFGIFLSYLLHLDVGTATLLAVLTSSASYIVVPAAMKISLPQAKEAIYLPLSLGVAFPFNIAVGIPLYYYFAVKFLT